MLPRPIESQPHYGRHLGDADYWKPFVTEALHRHSLPVEPLEAPFVGTFPTFLSGDLVVKLFGPGFDGDRSSTIEAAMHDLLADETAIPAPRVVVRGQLFQSPPTWPYLVTERLGGRAVREVELSTSAGRRIAEALGRVVHDLHRLPPPPEVTARELLGELRATAPARLRRFGLPEHLAAEVPAFLADAEPAQVLVHGDITADHVFVDGDRLVGIIDWGDALVADRAYELPAAYLDALRGDAGWLSAFLDAAEWPRADLARRGLQGILEFQFDAITAIAGRVDLSAVPTLDDLATRLFSPR